MNVGKLRVSLGVDTKEFRDGLSKARARLKGFGKKFAIAAGAGVASIGAGLVAATKSAMSRIDEQSKLAQSLGTSTKSVQVLGRAADLAGVRISELDQAGLKLTKRLSQAATGSGPAVKSLEALGLKARDILKLPLDQRIAKINTALANMKDPAARAAAAAQLFGDRAYASVGRIDASVIAQATKEVDKYGVAVSEVDANNVESANDAISALGLVWQGLGNQIAVAIAPAMKNFAKTLGELGQKVVGLAKWFRDLSPATQGLIVKIGAIGAVVAPLIAGLGILSVSFTSIAGAIGVATGAVSALSVALIANPIGAVIAAIAVGGLLIYKNWGTLKSMFSGLFSAIGSGAAAAAKALVSGLVGGFNAVTGALYDLWQKVLAIVTRWPGEFLKLGVNMIKRLGEGIASGWATVKAKVSSAGKFVVDGAVNGIAAGYDKAKGAGAALADAVASGFTSSAEIQSPSRLFARLGQFITQGLTGGISGGMGAVKAGGAAMTRALTVDPEKVKAGLGGISQGLQGVGGKAKSLGQTFRQTLGQSLGSAIDGLLDRTMTLRQALAGIAKSLAKAFLHRGLSMMFPSLNIPGFAGGTSFAPGGMAIVGENGPELVDLPRGSRVSTAGETAGMLGRAQQAAAQVHQKIVNVLDPSIVGDYLQTHAGEQLVMNVIRKNQGA